MTSRDVRASLVGVVVAALTLPACGDPPCIRHSDCSEGFRCSLGRCELRPDPDADGGVPDAAPSDGALDAFDASVDAAAVDATSVDATSVDATSVDATSVDAASVDAAAVDDAAASPPPEA